MLLPRVASVAEGGSELGLVVAGPPFTVTGYYIVVEAKEVEVSLNHRHAEIPGSKVTVKASEATEESPFHQTFANPFPLRSLGELVIIGKTIGGGSTFINLTALLIE